jgi:ubiquinone/menaquinone biosynthesis C-methylase UbiE
MQYNGWELHEFDHAENFRNYQFDIILKYIKGKTAEVGPGTGSNVKQYIKNTNSVSLYEPSKNLFKILKKKFKKNKKINFYNKSLNLSSKKFDTIIYLDVIEHIKNEKKEFNKAFNSLKKGGHLIMNVPAFNHLYSNFDKDVGHFKRYNKNDFKKLLNKKNYSDVKMIYFDSIGYFLSLISKITNGNYKNKFDKKIIIWNFLIPLSRVFDKLIFHLFGKSLMLVVKK